MSTTHTPAPWPAPILDIENGWHSQRIELGNLHIVITAAKAGEPHEDEETWEDMRAVAESISNARLIAAAPTILDTLRDCEVVLDSANRVTNGTCTAFKLVLEKVRTAINQATTP